MKKINFFMQATMLTSLISINSSILYGDIIRHSSGAVYDGEVNENGRFHGKGTITWANGYYYKGNFENGAESGKGIFVKVDEKTNRFLYTCSYDDKGATKNTRYSLENDNFNGTITIYYDKINKDLNQNKINKSEDLSKHIIINNRIKGGNNYNFKELIKQCAIYQMQTRLKGESGELDNKKGIGGGTLMVENLVLLAELINDIKSLKRVRFTMEQNSPEYPFNMYKNEESFLNFFEITTLSKKEIKESNLTSIDTLLDNGINYFSVDMYVRVAKLIGHTTSCIIDLKSIKNKEKYLFYGFDSKRISGFIKGIDSDLGNLQYSFQFYNHIIQEKNSDSSWYHVVCSTITAARYPAIVEDIRNEKIKPVRGYGVIVAHSDNQIKFNNFEILHMITLQKVAEDLGVGRFGNMRFKNKTEDQEFTKSSNRPRMINNIVNKEAKDLIKKNAAEYNIIDSKQLRGTYKSLLLIAKERGLEVEGVKELIQSETEEELNNDEEL